MVGIQSYMSVLHLQVRQLHWAQLIHPPPHPQSFPTVPHVVTCELPDISHVCSTRTGLIIFFVLLFSSLVLLFVRVHNQLRCASIRGIRGWLKSNRLNDVHAEFRTRSHRTPIPCARNLCFLLLYWTEDFPSKTSLCSPYSKTRKHISLLLHTVGNVHFRNRFLQNIP